MLKKYILLIGIAIGFSLLTNAQNKNSCGVTAGFTATDPACFPNCVVCTNLTGGATIFNWNFGDTTTSTAVSPTHCYKHTGSFQVVLVASNGACYDTSRLTVVVYPLPNVVLDIAATSCSPVCALFSDMSTVPGGGFIASESWSFGDGYVGIGATPSHCYVNPGNYLVTLIATTNEGCIDSAKKTLPVYPTPIASFIYSPIPITAGVQETFIDTNRKGIASYSWSFGDGTTGTGDTVHHTYAAGGIYNVTLKVVSDSGCEDSSSTIPIMVIAGIQSINSPNEVVSVYPNPSNGKFELKITNYESGIKNIEVYNLLGEKVYSNTSAAHFPLAIDISSQPTGMYFVKVVSGQSYKVLKFIKE